MAAADEFEKGQLSADGLTEARVRAWEYYDARPDSSPRTEPSGLRAVMHRLWPPEDTEHWHESAWHFLHFCEEAGLGKDQWWPLLQEQFRGILDGQDWSPSGATPDHGR